MYHLINLVVLALGAVGLYFFFKGKRALNKLADPYLLLSCVITIVVYQIAVYHEISLTVNLQIIPLDEWENIFIHLCKFAVTIPAPRLAFYVKKFYKNMKLDIEELEEA